MKRSGFSEFLHQRRIAVGRRWHQILAEAYLSRATLHRIRHADPHHPIAEVRSRAALAHALRFGSWDELVAAYEKGDPKNGIDSSTIAGAMNSDTDPVLSLSRALHVSPTELVRRITAGSGADFPSGLRIDQMQPVRRVPRFRSGVAASKRVEKLEDEPHEPQQPVNTQDPRVFTIPVDGDCQEPLWKHGELVVFSFDAYEREGILPGKSYYLAFTDGSTTFKRVFVDPEDQETYVLRCWNSRKYPEQRRVHFSEVVRIARAICKQVNPEE